MYSFLLALIYLAFISLGLPDSLLSSAWPVIYQDLSVPIPYLGIVSMITSGCTIVASLLSDKLTKKFGTRIVTVASVFLTSFALFGYGLSSRYWMLLVLAVPYGLGAGAIDAALNNYIALHYSSRHMSWLHCFWGVGAIISPFVMSLSLANATWHTGFMVVGFLQLGIAIILTATLPVWKVNKQKEEVRAPHVPLFRVIKIKGVPFILIGFFAYCAAEATAMGWMSTYFVKVKSLDPELAARFASLFYIGMTFGRFVGGFFMNKLGDRKMIVFGTAVIAVGITCILIPAPYWLSLVGFLVAGLGCAPIYPCIIHSTPQNFGAQNSGSVIGVQMACAYVGNTLIPPLFGVLGNAVGFYIMPVFLACFFVLMIVMTELTFRTAKANSAS